MTSLTLSRLPSPLSRLLLASLHLIPLPLLSWTLGLRQARSMADKDVELPYRSVRGKGDW